MSMLSKRRTSLVSSFMFKRLANKALVDNRDIRTRGHGASLFKVCAPKNVAYKQSVEYAGALQWNGLSKATLP